jgi:phosphotriesterase-related protein
MTQVMTVTGPIDTAQLGFTATHEHILNDVSSWWARSTSLGIDPDEFASRPVTMDILWDLKYDPFGNKDNCRMDDINLAIAEVARFAELGGKTIIDATGLGIGRRLDGLKAVSEATGVQIIAGTGFYLEPSQPGWLADATAETIAEVIAADITTGENGIRPGIIGEIGVGADFTAAERKSLRAACLVQRQTGLPMQVHLPAWFRRANEVLDLAESEGVDPCAIILCHMNPSGMDQAYQLSVLRRGAWVQYDMTGAELFYADQGTQCPSDEDSATYLSKLAEAGYVGQLLLSSDIFLKSLLKAYGGPGYAHILQYFLPRLRRHGFDDATITQLTVENPRLVYEKLENLS